MKQTTLVALLLAATFAFTQNQRTIFLREKPQQTEADFNIESCDNNILLQVTVKTIKMGIITSYSADCYYSVSGSNISESGVCWSTKPNPTISTFHLTGQGSPSQMSVLLNSLQASTKYYLKAYAKVGNEVIYGNEINFTTKEKNSNPNGSARPKSETKPISSKNG